MSQSMLYLWVVVTFSETREVKLEPVLDRKCPESSGPGADFPDLFAMICPVEGTDLSDQINHTDYTFP